MCNKINRLTWFCNNVARHTPLKVIMLRAAGVCKLLFLLANLGRLHSMGSVDIMISPAKEGWQRQYFDTESLKGQKNDTEN